MEFIHGLYLLIIIVVVIAAAIIIVPIRKKKKKERMMNKILSVPMNTLSITPKDVMSSIARNILLLSPYDIPFGFTNVLIDINKDVNKMFKTEKVKTWEVDKSVLFSKLFVIFMGNKEFNKLCHPNSKEVSVLTKNGDCIDLDMLLDQICSDLLVNYIKVTYSKSYTHGLNS